LNEEKVIPRWKIWEGIVAIVCIVLIMTVLGYAGEIFTRTWSNRELFFVFWASFAQTVLMVGASWYLAVVKHGHSVQDLGFVPRGMFPALPQGIKWGILLFLLVMILGILEAIIYPVEPELQDFAKILLMVDTNGELFLAVIMGVVLAPIGEEVYFRGFLYPALRHRWGVTKGILGTALFFSAMHFDLYRLIPIAVGGIGLTYLYEKTGNIWTNIVAHGIWNAIMISLIYVTYPGVS